MQSIQSQLPHWQEHRSRFTQIPNGVHGLVSSPRELQLVVHLLSYRWYPSSPIIPSVERLARDMQCSGRTVRRTAAALEARGLLRREARRAHDDRQMSNRYHLCGPLLALVTEMEANRDQEPRPQWQGGRTAVTGKRHPGNDRNRTRQPKPGYAPPTDPYDYAMTREGRYTLIDGRMVLVPHQT